MKNSFLLLFTLLQINHIGLNANNWSFHMLLPPTPTTSPRIAILIIAPPIIRHSFVEHRWMLGRKTWEQYMNSHPNIDCYFLQSTSPQAERADQNQVWCEENTIYVGDWWYEKYGNDRLLYKTVKAIEWLLPYYTHFIRTNLNTFADLNAVYAYLSTHSQNMYTTPLWEGQWFAIGYSIICTQDVAAHIVNEYKRLEQINEPLIGCRHADDCTLTSLATGIWPLTKRNPFQCCPSLPFQVRQLISIDSLLPKASTTYGVLLTSSASLKEVMQHCDKAQNTVMLYRIKNKLNLNELAELYQYLLHKHYPGLPHLSLTNYLQSLPPIP